VRLRRRDRAASSTTYKLCSLLLQYPDEELLDARPELSVVGASLPGSPASAALERFIKWWAIEDPLDLQQHYVETFDLDKRCGLYLTFYGEGDKRQRGMALLRLKRMYRAAGLPLEGSELPDFLPVMLEFAAAAPDGHGVIALREHRIALELLCASLRERGTPYADVLEAVCEKVGQASAADRMQAVKLATSGPPQELVGLEPFTPTEIVPSSGARR